MSKVYSLAVLFLLVFAFASCDFGVDPVPPSDPVQGTVQVVQATPSEGSTYSLGDTITLQVSYDIPNFNGNKYIYGLDMVIHFDNYYSYVIGYRDNLTSGADTVQVEGTYFGKASYMDGDPIYPYEIAIILYRYMNTFEFISMTSSVIYY